MKTPFANELNFSSFIILWLIFTTFFCVSLAQGQGHSNILEYKHEVDLTREPNTKGKDVVSAVEHLITLSGIFPETERFLTRLAWIESEFGNNADTYDPPNQGGIWKINSTKLDATQFTMLYPHLEELHAKILNVFSIDWMRVEMAELDKPLYSGIAARLYMTTIPALVPISISEQAYYWRQYFNQNENLNIGTFINSITSLEQVFTCAGKLDLVLILDGSGSVAVYFNIIKFYIAGLVSQFSLEHINVGVVVYDSYQSVVIRLPLNNSLSSEELFLTILSIPTPTILPGTGKRPDLAIDTAIKMLRYSSAREGAPKIIATFYDGEGNSNRLSVSINEASVNGIVTYSVPVGDPASWTSSPNKENFLITAGNVPTQILWIPSTLDEISLTQFAYKLNSQVCRLSQNRILNVGDVLLEGETRYYNYDLKSMNSSLQLLPHVHEGEIKGYYSYSVPNPSSALNDGSFIAKSSTSNAYIIPSNGKQSIFVAIRGESGLNYYTIIGIINDLTLY